MACTGSWCGVAPRTGHRTAHLFTQRTYCVTIATLRVWRPVQARCGDEPRLLHISLNEEVTEVQCDQSPPLECGLRLVAELIIATKGDPRVKPALTDELLQLGPCRLFGKQRIGAAFRQVGSHLPGAEGAICHMIATFTIWAARHRQVEGMPYRPFVVGRIKCYHGTIMIAPCMHHLPAAGDHFLASYPPPIDAPIAS